MDERPTRRSRIQLMELWSRGKVLRPSSGCDGRPGGGSAMTVRALWIVAVALARMSGDGIWWTRFSLSGRRRRPNSALDKPREVNSLDRIHRVNPGLGEDRVGVASSRQPRECRKMHVHAGDQDTVGRDTIEHALARSRGCGEIGIE